MFKRNRAIELLLKCTIMIGIVAVFATQIVMPQYEFKNYLSVRQKYDRLCNIEQPKIILAGNSNVWYGFRSDILEQSLGMSVVNFGMPAPLGAVYSLEQAKDSINAGDIVVFSGTSVSVTLKDDFVPQLAWGYFEKDLSLYKGVLPRLYGKLLHGYPIYFREALNVWMKTAKNTSGINKLYIDTWTSFNEYGDIWNVANPTIGTQLTTETNGIEYRLVYSSEIIEYLNDYQTYVTEKGATMLFTFVPAVEGMDISKMGTDLDTLQEKINIPIISLVEEKVYPPRMFDGTQFHMNAEGSIEQTKRLIVDIKRYFKENNN